MGHRFKMVRIAAGGVFAEVVKDKTHRNIANMGLVKLPVAKHLLAIHPCGCIAMIVRRCVIQPAPAIRLLMNTLVEAIDRVVKIHGMSPRL